MLSERQLEQLLKVFEERMQDVTDEYLRRMGEHIRDIGELSETDVHRLKQLKRMNANVEAVKRRIAQAAEANAADIEQVFRAAAESDAAFAQAMYAEDHTPEVKTSRIKTLSSPLERILKAQLRITAQEMANLSRTTIESTLYREAVDKAVQIVQTGLTDYNSAIRAAMKKAAEGGLKIVYPPGSKKTTASGDKVVYPSGYSRRLDTAVRQNVLDGVRALNRDILEQLGKEYGADGVEISAHELCAADHLPYQGLQFKKKDFDRIQNTLDRPIGMWNCKHTIYPVIIGVSEPTHSREELERYRKHSTEAVTIDGVTLSRYEWTQEQRKIETNIRAQKNIAVVAKAYGDMPARREAQRNINAWQEQYTRISRAAGVDERPDKMTVAGFRKVKAADR